MTENLQSVFQYLNLHEVTFRGINKFILKTLSQVYKFILVIFLIFMLATIYNFMVAPIEYNAKSVVVLEQSTNQNVNDKNNLLTNLLGSELQNTNNGFGGPDMYKDILESKAFLTELVYEPFPKDLLGKDSTCLMNYFQFGENNEDWVFRKNKNKSDTIDFLQKSINNKNTNSLVYDKITPDIIFSYKIPPIIREDVLTKNVCDIILNRISIETKGKMFTVIVKFPDPFLSAVVNRMVLQKLISYITLNKTMKQKDNIEYLEKMVSESEARYKKAQFESSTYKDNNLGSIFESSRNKEQFLNNELSISFNLYNQFAVALNNAKIELKKETPLFSILNPITIPSEKSDPLFLTLLLKYMLSATVISLCLFIYKLCTIKVQF
jgi:hypothetical protein